MAMAGARIAAAGAAVSLIATSLSGCGGGAVVEDGVCAGVLLGTPKDDTATAPTASEYQTALGNLDMAAVKTDMAALLKDSKACWPADWGNYGPFMVRLAWHASGTYRGSDKLGGSGGARQRFEPERSWEDNANLDKARALVSPLKEKYGDSLSWGDLFILAGTTALRESGAPITRMCFGRQDDTAGSKSDELNKPCGQQGNCNEPWGSTTVGLIYVNPEGPMGEPNPAGSVAEIRRTFGSMGHSDRGTVALIGGGHSIGKGHGACPAGAGLAPKEAFAQGKNIYEGTCNTNSAASPGKGLNTATAGFEGAWTSKPLEWDNEYFSDLLNKEWEKWEGPGGHWQWRIKGEDAAARMRLTSDMALLEDDSYKAIVTDFAANMTLFNEEFDTAWDILTSNGGQWSSASKCDDGSTPPAADAIMRVDDVTMDFFY